MAVTGIVLHLDPDRARADVALAELEADPRLTLGPAPAEPASPWPAVLEAGSPAECERAVRELADLMGVRHVQIVLVDLGVEETPKQQETPGGSPGGIPTGIRRSTP